MELKLAILYYIYYEEYYDKDLFEKLIILSLKDNFSDILYIRGDAINRYLYEKPEIVLPYINNVLKQKRAQPLLTQLTFLGIGYGSLECQELLEILLSENSEEIIINAVKMSSKNLRDSTYRELSLNILRRFSSDQREKIIENYCFSFHEFLACDFELFLELFDKLYPNLDVENIYGIFKYLKINCAIYPIECYKCIDMLIKLDRKSKMRDEDAELELLLAVYKSIKNDVPENSEILEQIMDTFDFVMKNNFSAYRMNKVLQSIERI